MDYFATLVCKSLVKHGWPAVWHTARVAFSYSFFIDYHPEKGRPCPSFWAAVSIAVRVTAKTHRVAAIEDHGFVELTKPYIVTERGAFRESLYDLPR